MKILLILLFANVLLQASYTKVLRYYEQGKYHKVQTEAKKSYSDYNNPKLHLLWAKSAEKTGLTTEAMSAYERVLILDEENEEAATALALIYQNTNRNGLSVNPYAVEKNGKWKARANLSLGYDNNLNANPGGDALDEYYGVVGNKGTLSSQFIRFTGDVSYTYQLEEAEGWFLKGTFNIYNQSNFSAHKYDLLMGTIEVATGYTAANYSFYLPLSYDKIHYLNKSLMERYRLMPRVFIPIFTDSLLDLSLNYTRRSYIDKIDKNNDANSFGVGAGIFFPIENSLAHINIKYEKRTSDNNLINQFIDATFINVDASIKHSFNDSLTADAKYSFRYGDYNDDVGTLTTPSSIKRVDYFNQIDFKLSYILKPDVELYVRDVYANNSSNYIPTEYNKNIFMVGINLTY